MTILILGSGGREHTFAWKINQSPLCTKLYVAPGNSGTAEIAENVNINVTDFEAIKIFFKHDSHAKLLELRERILEKHPDTFSHAFSLPHCLEFMNKSVDKSVAIGQILEKEGYGFHQVISFGDGYNDEGMLNATAKGLLMGNAPDSLKSKLAHLEVISKNHEDGVANYLADKILNNVSIETK